MTNITPGTQVRVLTSDGAPWVLEGEVVTIIDPNQHWTERHDSPAPHWPEDALAAEHEMSGVMGPMALYEGEYEVVGQEAA